MIHQGHKYTYEGQPVLAMEDATRGLVRVRRIDPAAPLSGMQSAIYVAAERLVPVPMRYFGGQVFDAHKRCA